MDGCVRTPTSGEPAQGVTCMGQAEVTCTLSPHLAGQADEFGRSQRGEGSARVGVLGEGHAEGSGSLQFCEQESK